MFERVMRLVGQLGWIFGPAMDGLVGRNSGVLSLELWLGEAVCMRLHCPLVPQELRRRKRVGRHIVEVRHLGDRLVDRQDRGIELDLDQEDRPVQREKVSYGH